MENFSKKLQLIFVLVLLALLVLLKLSAKVQYSYNTTAIQELLVLQLYCTCADRLSWEFLSVFERKSPCRTVYTWQTGKWKKN